jgi:hypothetical protein
MTRLNAERLYVAAALGRFAPRVHGPDHYDGCHGGRFLKPYSQKNAHIWPITPVSFNMPMLTIDILETTNVC